MSNLLKKEKGFTLIEIVLVLAIAGLLLVIVFLAVSGAQKSRRDTQRKNDLSTVAAQLESFASNNNGKYPEDATLPTATTFAAFATAYKLNLVTGNLKDALSGNVYTFADGATPTVPSATTSAGVSYVLGSDCDGVASGTRVYAVYIGLEQGAKNCRTNK